MKKKMRNIPAFRALICMFFLLFFWQASSNGKCDLYILLPQSRSLAWLWELLELLLQHLQGNYVCSIGLCSPLCLAGLAVLMDANDTARRALYPLIIASQTILLQPWVLAVLWFGYSIWGKVLAVVHSLPFSRSPSRCLTVFSP